MKSKRTDPILDGSTEDEDFFNRELSWLAFNERVLSLAEDEEKPPGERIRFLAISADNLNEFFMVRVAGLLQLVDRGFKRLPDCLLYTSPSPRDRTRSRMPSSA